VTFMFSRQLSRVVWSDFGVAARRVRTTTYSFAKSNRPHVPLRPYSASGIGSTPSNQDKIDDNALPRLDIDAMESISRHWFGDQSTWSHNKLLSLMVCKLRFVKDK
jgi:hypothetical protein